jgi:hypothetical protein
MERRTFTLTDKVVDKVHFPLRLAEQTGRSPRAGTVGREAVGAPRMLAHLRRHRTIRRLGKSPLGKGREAYHTRVPSGPLMIAVIIVIIFPDHIYRVSGRGRDL